MLSAITRRKCLLPQVLIIFKLVENTPWGQFSGSPNFIKPFLQLITWSEVHRLAHFRSGVQA